MTTREEVIAAAKEVDPSIDETTVDFDDEVGMKKLERFADIFFKSGAASRDAEVAEKDVLIHGLRDELASALIELEQVIDKCAQERDKDTRRLATVSTRVLDLEQTRDQLRAELVKANTAYEVVQKDCWNLTQKVIPNLRQQLAASQKREAEALAACKAKDKSILSALVKSGASLAFPLSDTEEQRMLREALAIQPDDAALKRHDAAIWREAASVCRQLGEFLHGESRDDSEAFDCADTLNIRADVIEEGSK